MVPASCTIGIVAGPEHCTSMEELGDGYTAITLSPPFFTMLPLQNTVCLEGVYICVCAGCMRHRLNMDPAVGRGITYLWCACYKCFGRACHPLPRRNHASRWWRHVSSKETSRIFYSYSREVAVRVRTTYESTSIDKQQIMVITLPCSQHRTVVSFLDWGGEGHFLLREHVSLPVQLRCSHVCVP